MRQWGVRGHSQRWASSAVAHLWYLHGERDEFSRVLTGAAAVTVQLHLGAAAILFLPLLLRGQPDVSVRGEAAAHGRLQRSRQQDHEVVEAAVQAGEKKQRTVVWRRREDKERRRMSPGIQVCSQQPRGWGQLVPPEWESSEEKPLLLLCFSLSEHAEKMEPPQSRPPQEPSGSNSSESGSRTLLSLQRLPADLLPVIFSDGLTRPCSGILPLKRQHERNICVSMEDKWGFEFK